MSHTSNMIGLINRITNKLQVKLNMMVSRVVINAIQDSPGIQTATIQALAGEVFDKLEHLQPGGLTHVVLPGAEGVLLCLGGSRENAVVLGVSNRGDRPTGLLAGETSLYAAGPLGGTKILLKADGEVEITPTSVVTVNGNVLATGQVTANGGLPATKVTLANHTHTTGVGPSGPPIIPEP